MSCARCNSDLNNELPRASTYGHSYCPKCGEKFEPAALRERGERASLRVEDDDTVKTLMIAGFGATVVGLLFWLVAGALFCAAPFLVTAVALWPLSIYRFAAGHPKARGSFGVIVRYHLVAGLFMAALAGIVAAVLPFIEASKHNDSSIPTVLRHGSTWKLIATCTIGPAVIAWSLSRYNPYWLVVRRHWMLARRSVLSEDQPPRRPLD